MNELLFLLLPLAFYSGWKASGKNHTAKPHKQRHLSDNFVKGVNFLLNEEPDKALDVFLNRPDIDEYTAETYLLLGNLFRNRGEVDRALSVHQNLIGRASLNRQQKSTTMLALGKDFLAAGMMDRAEQVFTELLQGEENAEEARDALRNIYEQTQEWSKAIAVTKASNHIETPHLANLIANYYCELAEAELATGHIQRANEQLANAKKSFPESVRLDVIRARIHTLHQEYDQSAQHYLNVVQKAPRLLGMVYEAMVKAYQQAGRIDSLQDELFAVFKDSADAKVLEYTLRLATEMGPSTTIQYALPNILTNQSLNVRTIHQATRLYCQLENGNTDALTHIYTALDKHLSSQPGYLCQHCGYKMHDFLWRCPACNHWDEVVHV